MKSVFSILLLSIFLFNTHYSYAQNNEKIEQVVFDFFKAFQTIDTVHLRNAFTPSANLHSSFIKEDSPSYQTASIDKLIEQIGKTKKNILEERVSNLQITSYGNLATAVMDYEFYINQEFSHCGINIFQMIKNDEHWLISSITDTRKKGCTESEDKTLIDSMLIKWHLAASNADSTSYFDLILDDGIFVGTDSSEVWSKKEFLAFSAPYFARGKAWEFKTIDRNIYIKQENVAWFDELLDTWMGPCRGSGVIKKIDGNWKIAHYVLSVTIPNDDIQEFIDISKK